MQLFCYSVSVTDKQLWYQMVWKDSRITDTYFIQLVSVLFLCSSYLVHNSMFAESFLCWAPFCCPRHQASFGNMEFDDGAIGQWCSCISSLSVLCSLFLFWASSVLLWPCSGMLQELSGRKLLFFNCFFFKRKGSVENTQLGEGRWGYTEVSPQNSS